MKQTKILIIDDHPIIAEGYKNALLSIENEKLSFEIVTSQTCESAYEDLKLASEGVPFDVILLDLQLPASEKLKISSGKDLGLVAKKLMPKVKIIVQTMCNDNFTMHDILKNLNPDGFLIKSDITSEILHEAIEHVLSDSPYYSDAINKFIRVQLTNDLNLDDVDRKILYLLSKGIRTKNLPSFIPLSLAAIEKRKRNLKNLFGVERANSSLIEIAIKKGYI